MPGLDPGIHGSSPAQMPVSHQWKRVDGRVKPGHDDVEK
jgi:hypothetical protein